MIGDPEVGELTGFHGQRDYSVRFDWGPVGAQATAADISVIVDVLSFSTSVCIAVERGMQVYPYPWKGALAEAYALERGAVLAVGRLEASKQRGPGAPSLSPAGLLGCQPVPRLVLPSPNGSTIAAALRDSGSVVVAGCLRNAAAVAEWSSPRLHRDGSVAIIAAGERWDRDDSLRPALEDHLGAGAILSALTQRGFGPRMSPEASTAAAVFIAVGDRLRSHVRECVSGRELVHGGFGADVEVAAAIDASCVVPVLVDGAFRLGEPTGDAPESATSGP